MLCKVVIIGWEIRVMWGRGFVNKNSDDHPSGN